MKVKTRHPFKWSALLLLILFTCTPALAADAEQKPGTREKPLVVAFTTQSFFNVDPRDAIGAARVWIRQADRKLGNPMPSVVLNFFGQADSCIASLTSFETLSELNPQLGKKLKTLGKSPGFATGIIALRKEGQNRRRDALIDAFKVMDGDPKGKQLLTMFRINRLVPFQPGHLDSVEKLFREVGGPSEKRIRRK